MNGIIFLFDIVAGIVLVLLILSGNATSLHYLLLLGDVITLILHGVKYVKGKG